jgi:hypothetical protein
LTGDDTLGQGTSADDAVVRRAVRMPLRLCAVLADEAERTCKNTGAPPHWPLGRTLEDVHRPGFNIFGPGNLPSPGRTGWKWTLNFTALSGRGFFRLHCPVG